MKTLAVIQARMSSSRLPGKVLKPLAGRPLIAWLVASARKIPGVDDVVVATSTHGSDDQLVSWLAAHDVRCERGPLDDVLGRFVGVATALGLGDDDAIMRLTADCPLLDPMVCGFVLAAFKRDGVDFASNVAPPTWPDGLDCQVFKARALREAHELATHAADREHVGPFIARNSTRYSAVNVHCPLGDLSGHRWTVDTAGDLVFVEDLLAASRANADFLTLVDTLDRNPALAARSIAPNRNGTAAGTSAAAAPRLTRAPSAGYIRSSRTLERAERAIPLGSQTFSKSHLQFPNGHAPLFLSHGYGSRVVDVDGNEYVDLVNGLLPVVLGYCDQDVDDAIRKQLDRGISFSLATELEAELAEHLIRLVPCAQMVRFGKNGSDATSGAIRLARAATERDRVAICGYHGWHDWYIGTTTRNLGVPDAVAQLSHVFAYNDAPALEKLLDSKPGEFAAVVMEVANATAPAPGFLEAVRDITRKRGVVLIFDEIITGFRFHLGGAQTMFGVTPDLACFGKSMANGMPISAIVGSTELMRHMNEIFFSGTFGGEALSLRAAIATIEKLERVNGIEALWGTGRDIAAGVSAAITRHGLEGTIGLAGYDPWRLTTVVDHPHARKEAIKTRLGIELVRHGVLFNGGHNVSVSFTPADVAQVVHAYDAALARIARELEGNGLEENLPCPAVEPVFKVR